LGREPANAEITGWASILTHGATEEFIITNIMASPEFALHAQVIATRPETLNSEFVQALYALLLGRQASTNEVNVWIGPLTMAGRASVITSFLNSAEFRSYTVDSLYFTDPIFPPSSIFDTLPNMLHRPTAPTVGEVNGWVGTPFDILTLEAVFASTPEFYDMG